MIEINLVPSNLRKKKRGKMFAGLNLPPEVVIGSISGVVLLIVMIHCLLFVSYSLRKVQFNNLTKKWEDIGPAKENSDSVVKEMKKLQKRHTDLKGVVSRENIVWSEKINLLSDSLPRGVWLKKVDVRDQLILIEGSAISKQKKEMINVHKFTSNLKNQKKFLEGLNDLELGSIQSKKVNKTEVADFVITAEIK